MRLHAPPSYRAHSSVAISLTNVQLLSISRVSAMFVQDALALLVHHYAKSKCDPEKVGSDENFVFVVSNRQS